MFSRKNLKTCAKLNFKSHYGIFVIACLFAAFLGVAYSGTLTTIQSFSSANIRDSVSDNIRTNVGTDFASVLDELLDDNFNNAEQIANNSLQKTDKNFHGLEFGHQRGVLASVINTVSSGAFLITIYSAINKMVGSQDIAYILFSLIILIVMFVLWFLIINTYNVIYRRIFLEGRIYEKVPIQRFIYLYKSKTLVKTAFTLFLTSVFKFLWDLTIIGGFIKHYSYFMVPYIVAENPNIKPLDAINLSRKMMKGHKWQCFVIDLSFIGWDILGFFTIGLLSLFFINPYKESVYCEYYAYIRKHAIKSKLENTDMLNDVYLYKKATNQEIKETYSDIIELMDKPIPAFVERKGFWKFMADVFGIIPSNDKSEQEYIEYNERILKIKSYKMYLDGRVYPTRLYPDAKKEKSKKIEYLHYTRHYSICSLILIFFIICFIGFIWEVSLNLIIEGGFAKKGMLHGPWLPIYGSGSIMILTLLNKLKTKPVLEFGAAVVLCGIVEYITSLILEAAHHGQMWWDYSGYFLNLNGRICAEGLLMFGLGGIGIVYFVAPILDNWIRKIPKKVVLPLCIVLTMLFLADFGYSSLHPNTGKGITDYDSVKSQQVIETSPNEEETTNTTNINKIKFITKIK